MLLTFDFKTAEEAHAFLLKNFTNQTADIMVLAAQPTATESRASYEKTDGPFMPAGALVERATNPTATEVQELLGKKKRGPKPKAAPELVKEKEYGTEDCRAALSGLFDIKGRDTAKAALAEFKVARIGELKADQYRGFIVLCETLSQPE